MFVYAAILVGFENILTTVDEDVGSFEICVRIFTEVLLFPTAAVNFSLNLVSLPDKAGNLQFKLYTVP